MAKKSKKIEYEKWIPIGVSLVAVAVSVVSCSSSQKANEIATEANNFSQEANSISKEANVLSEETSAWQLKFTKEEAAREKQDIRQKRLKYLKESLDNGWHNEEVFRKLRNKEEILDNYNFLRFIDPFEEAEEAIIRGEIYNDDIRSKFYDELYFSCQYQQNSKEKLVGHNGFRNLCSRLFTVKL